MKVEHFALPPAHPLRPYVRGIWKISNAAPGHGERIMPRAVVDVLFPLSGQVWSLPADRERLRSSRIRRL